MSDDPQLGKLEEANQQLQDGLKHCRELVAEYRGKLAANGNEPWLLNNSNADQDAASS